jgi:translocation and assembly module TamB
VLIDASSGHLRVSPAEMASSAGESLHFSADLDLKSPGGILECTWNSLQLARFNVFMPGIDAPLVSSGRVFFTTHAPGSAVVEAEVSGAMTWRELELDMLSARAGLRWNGQGLESSIAVRSHYGSIDVRFDSDEPFHPAMPTMGVFNVTADDIDLSAAGLLLPAAIELQGTCFARGQGRLMEKTAFEMSGSLALQDSTCVFRNNNSEIAAKIHTAESVYSWKNNMIQGTFKVGLEGYGMVQSAFELPVASRFPVRIIDEGALQVEVSARITQLGFVSYLVPGAVRETTGEVALELAVTGTAAAPRLRGWLTLEQAGTYLPQIGIELRDMAAQLSFDGNRIYLDRLYVASGQGFMQARGSATINGLDDIAYEVAITGEEFQIARLPELRITAEPSLSIEGTSRSIIVRGDILLPLVNIYGQDTTTVIHPTEDIVFIDIEKDAGKKSYFDLVDIRVMVTLGETCTISAEGIEAAIAGSALLEVHTDGAVTARGEIRAVQGMYSKGSIRLAISRGSIIFDDGPVNQPKLDILAVRQIGDITAGVQILGTLQNSLVTLYSVPYMQDTDVLSYIVLGRAFDHDSGQVNMLMVAASTILARDEFLTLQEKVQKRLGVDVLDIEAVNGDDPGSVITVGKYLNPKIYISFGHAIFTNISQARLRYTIDDSWQIESSIGTESGVDLFYRFTFKERR